MTINNIGNKNLSVKKNQLLIELSGGFVYERYISTYFFKSGFRLYKYIPLV